ncbi:MAG: tetratricopeptide repeat protein, partial [Anaerolineae bacterium]|nr:tetratricopeptide repeat protein [Anaerolineae bacterium]
LVTSRERLNLRGEWVIELGGLRLPGVDAGPQSLDLQTYDALQLFAESARRVSGGFALDAANLEDVLRICRLVEGIPLGIELAAAWTRLLSCAEIVSEIEQGIDFLSTTMRDLPARHQSLRAVFEHSWTLLSATDREQFCKLAIFRGGFTREAAREIANASLQDLSVLVDKSLLRRTWSGRYEMLVVLRQYAEEKLQENPEVYVSVQALHSRYYVDYLVRLEPDLKGHKQVAALGALTADLENVRRAWHWILDNHRFDELRQCFNTLNLFYDIRSLPQEGFEVFALAATALRQFVEQHSDVGDEIRALLGEMLSNQGRFAGRIYRYDVARDLLREGLGILEPLGASSALAFANLYALTALLFSTPQEQKAKLQKSVAIFRSLGDRWAEAITLSILGEYTYYWHAGFDVALNYMQQSLEITHDLGDRWGISKTLFAMGSILQAQGKRREAQECYAESLECRRALRDTWGIAITLDYMGYVTRRLGEYEKARELHTESLAISKDIGDYLGIGGSLDNLGLVAYDSGDYATAKDYFEKGLIYRRQVFETSDDVAYSLEHLGDVAAATGDYGTALDYYEQSLAIYSEIWASHPRRGRCLERRGWLFVLLGEVSNALSDFRLALQLLSGVDNVSFCLPVLHGCVKIWLQVGKVDLAVKLLGFLWQHPALSYQLQQQVAQTLDEVRDLFPPGDFQTVLSQGEQLSLEEVISLVMED